MKPFIKIVKKKGKDHTLALIREKISTSKPNKTFGSIAETTKVIACDWETGEAIPEENLSLGDTSAMNSIKLNGKVIKLTPTIRAGLNYTEAQLSSLGEFELVKVSKKENLDLFEDEAYQEFKEQALDAFGLNTTNSSDLYGALKTYDGKKHILVTGDAG